jgi:two-component system LytT family response regulator
MKTVIIDDEAKVREELSYLLEKYCPGITVCAIAEDFQSGYEAIERVKPDLLFVDVQLNSPEGSGMDLIAASGMQDNAVIFISGHRDYAVDAFRFSAVDYLMKPLRLQQLKEAVQKAEDWLLKRSQNTHTPGEITDSFHIPTHDGVAIVRPGEIIRCEADGAYTYFFTKTKREHITSSANIGQIESKLGADFLRVHKSHIINKNCVTGYSKTEGLFVKMVDGHDVPVSKSHKKMFLAWLGRN